MPVVGNNLIFTPICIIACIKTKLIDPTKISFILLSFSPSTFLRTEKIKYRNNNNIKIIATTPNSSDITEII